MNWNKATYKLTNAKMNKQKLKLV